MDSRVGEGSGSAHSKMGLQRGLMRAAYMGTTALVALTLLVGEAQAQAAADLDWAPGGTLGGDGSWDTGSLNWTADGGASDTNFTNGDNATFGGTAGTVTIDAGGVTAGDITISTDGYTITGGTLTKSTADLTVSTGTSTISSNISGSAGLTKNGAGTVVLSGNNTYTGLTTISSGQVTLGSATSLGAAGQNLNVRAGVLDLGGFNISRFGTALEFGGIVQNGTITATTVLDTAHQTARVTVNAVLAGGAGVGLTHQFFEGTLGAANTYQGNTVVNSGTLNVTGAGSILNSASVTVASGATLNVDGAALSSSQSVTNNGTLQVDTGAENAARVNGTGGVSLVNGGTLFTDGSSTVATLSGNGTWTIGGGGDLTLTGNNATSGATVRIGSGSSADVGTTFGGTWSMNPTGRVC